MGIVEACNTVVILAMWPTPQLFMRATHLEQIAHDYEKAEEHQKLMKEGISRQETVRWASRLFVSSLLSHVVSHLMVSVFLLHDTQTVLTEDIRLNQ